VRLIVEREDALVAFASVPERHFGDVRADVSAARYGTRVLVGSALLRRVPIGRSGAMGLSASHATRRAASRTDRTVRARSLTTARHVVLCGSSARALCGAWTGLLSSPAWLALSAGTGTGGQVVVHERFRPPDGQTRGVAGAEIRPLVDKRSTHRGGDPVGERPRGVGSWSPLGSPSPSSSIDAAELVDPRRQRSAASRASARGIVRPRARSSRERSEPRAARTRSRNAKYSRAVAGDR
jgi:hypothetical protein